MAGHSKWANIKHRKSKQDAAKGKIFTRLIREITVASRGGTEIGTNSRLRLAVDKALTYNMSMDTIERAIKRGHGSENQDNLEEITYEGYAVGGVAVLVECLTDNRNRTAGEVRHLFAKHGGNLGTTGSVAYLFKQSGLICFAPTSAEVNEDISLVAIDHGAEDVITNEDASIEIVSSRENFSKIKTALEANGWQPALAELSMIAANQIALAQEDNTKLLAFIDALDALDDVQNIYHNAAVSDEYS